jgi:hypothetical protein
MIIIGMGGARLILHLDEANMCLTGVMLKNKTLTLNLSSQAHYRQLKLFIHK